METHIEVVEIAADERETISGGRKLLRGRALSSIVEDLGGYEGTVKLWTGETLPISVEQWRDRDPDSTYLSIQVVSDRIDLSPLQFSGGDET